MRLHDRYLLRELLIPLVYCLGGFLIFWVSFDLFAELETFQKYGLHSPDVVELYWTKLPEILVLVMPIGLLLALLYALTNHSRHHELTALRAAGLPLARIVLPYLGIGLFFSGTVFALNELAVPQNADRVEHILNRRRGGRQAALQRDWHRHLYFINTRDRHTWQVGAYNVRTHDLLHPRIDLHLEDGSHRQIYAERGWREEEVWVFTNVTEIAYPAGSGGLPNVSKTNWLALPELTESPRLINSELKIANVDSLKAAKKTQLAIREILEYRALHPQMEAGRRDMLDTKLHHRLALPWTSVIVVLIAVPFGATSGRRNVFVGVAASVFICFIFFVVSELALAFGTGGHVPPWVAAWTPNLLFGLTGLWLLQRAR